MASPAVIQGAASTRSPEDVLAARATRLSMVAVIQRGAAEAVKADPKPLMLAPYNHPLTRRDEADMSALVNAFLCGEPIDRIGEWNDRGSQAVTADEVLDGDPYRTRFVQEVRKL